MARIDRFFDERFAIDFLSKVPELDLSPSRVAGCEIIPLKVKDDKTRGVVMFRLSLRQKEVLPTTPVSVIGKFRRSSKDKQSLAVMLELWEKGFGGQSKLRVPQPIAYIDEWHLMLSYSANGFSLEQLLKAGHKSISSCVIQTGQWLAQLHNTVALSARTRSVEDEAEEIAKRFERTIRKFEKKHSPLTQRAQGLMDEIVQRVKTAAPNSFKLTHDDFLPKNVLSDGSDLTVIDIGRVRFFDPAQAVGKFIGHLTVKTQVYAPSLDPGVLRGLFLGGYGQDFSREFWERVEAYEARSYVKRSAKEDDPGAAQYWLQKTEECLRGRQGHATEESSRRSSVHRLETV